jgi:UDP-N-acetylmuramoyl-L-alanyl-D-glutamate--2,6-diaminopimelate ligase
MKTINDIIRGVEVLQIIEGQSKQIRQVHFDSRKVQSGDMFIAVNGTQVDGHQYIYSCIAHGASAIVCEQVPENIQIHCTYIQVANSAHALGQIASNFYDNPSEKINLVGVTGTNGKTSTVTMLFNLYRSLGYHVGLLSTVVNRIDDTIIPSTHTTPDALQLNALLADMVDTGCEYCFMEVSSHAIVQERISGLTFRGAVFSNITHDHLDFHKTFKEYIKAKKRFFDLLPANAFALVNGDDKNGAIMLQNTLAHKKFFALKTLGDYKARVLENTFSGLQLEINQKLVYVPLVGGFNAYNILSVYAVAMELGADEMEVLRELSQIKTAEGRFDYISGSNGISAIVDYAHTPDALLNVLNTINEVREGAGQLITLIGAGGDRDKSKRPEMARIAAENSDRVILTSDNPRSEDPEAILDDMEAGIPIDRKRKCLRISLRKEAIKTAVALAQSGDIILLAGKGHEKYQEIKGLRHHFDDKEIISELILNNE